MKSIRTLKRRMICLSTYNKKLFCSSGKLYIYNAVFYHMTKIAIIDCQIAGISGDMLLSSLIDAGADRNKIISAIISCQNFLEGSKITNATFIKTKTHGFYATQFDFQFRDTISERNGMKMFRSLALCCDFLKLEQRAKTFALESFKTLISAEALVHGEDINSIHLHESSSIDTFADLIGCATALQDLKLFESQIFSTRVAIGGGLLKFSHGIISNPTNAILEIFKGKSFTLIGGPVDEEITTPTGAAMLVNLTSESINYYPSFSPEIVGYGAGLKKFSYIPNTLRFVIGRSHIVYDTTIDTIFMIETNIDDISGEIIGNMIEQLTKSGAKDVTVLQGISKKNRPTHLIRIISDQTQVNTILEILFRESGTIGARIQEVRRIILPRSIVTVPVKIHNNFFNIHVKITKDSYGRTITVKPEFQEIVDIASRTGISVKQALDLTNAQLFNKVGRN
jgi:pyridinium-3,5-bisthiocarboxylic acid mononucleotide nickel chelatase